jgi:HAE1 family hydrophobic/amphiphilic exporter-1
VSNESHSFVTRRPVAILMIFLAAVVFGYFSYGRLPVTLMPELSYPTLTVRTEYPGAAPEEVENDITRPVEEALGVIGGLRRISSVSRADVSDVVLEFTWDTEMSDAVQDTLEKLDLVFLPDEAERPLILRFDPSLDPVLELSLSGEGQQFEGEEGLRRLRRIAELQVKRALEPVKGVAAVRVRGGLEEEIHVLLDEEQLRRTNISAQQVIERLAQENINVAGGTLKEGNTEYMVRTINEYQNLGQIEDTVVVTREGRQIRIRDLGRVGWGHKERQITTRTDGSESVQIEVFKEADANMVSLAQSIKMRVGDIDKVIAAEAEAAEEKPEGEDEPEGERRPGGQRETELAAELYRDEGVILKLVADRSVFIESSVNEVRNTAIIGGLLAVLVLFLFLRKFVPTLIIAVSIPISLLDTFAPMNILGVSLNIMSLGGLAMGIGMLVDSSIVVLESIYRCREEGDDLESSASRGASEVRMAVVASTLTSIAVFFPMVFVVGVAGQAFGNLGLAVVISLLVSLLVAIFFIPMLASRRGIAVSTLAERKPSFWPTATWHVFRRDFNAGSRFFRWPFLIYWVPRLVLGTVLEIVGKLLYAILMGLSWIWQVFLGKSIMFVFWLITVLPLKVMNWLLALINRGYPPTLRWAVNHPMSMVLFTVLSIGATGWLALSLDSELLPEVHQGEFTVEVALPVGTPLEETVSLLTPVEQAVLAEREHIDSLLLTFGFDPATSQRSDEGEHTAKLKVILDTSDPRVEAQVANRVRRKLEKIPDLESRVVRPVLFSFRTPIEVEVHGEDLPRLRQMAEKVRGTMAGLPELTDVETTQRSGAPEVQIEYDRDQLSRFGLNIARVADQVRNAVKGYEATRFNLGDRRIPLIVRYEEADRNRVEDIRDFVVNPGGEHPIPLSAVAAINLAEGPSEVRRVDGRRVALVTANLGQGALGNAVAGIEKELNALDWPSDMTFYITGQNLEWERSRGSLILALSLSIFLVYVIMAAQFESLMQPLVIMLTIPLAFLGTMLTLKLLGISLSVVVFLGMIMLAGIVVNNAIVFIDYINTLRRRGMERDEAIVTAGTVRLRPILMTTATTALGLLPMALGLGDGAEIRTPMAISVISGLIVSTLLTLLVIPGVYAVIERGRDLIFGSREADAPSGAGIVEGEGSFSG